MVCFHQSNSLLPCRSSTTTHNSSSLYTSEFYLRFKAVQMLSHILFLNSTVRAVMLGGYVCFRWYFHCFNGVYLNSWLAMDFLMVHEQSFNTVRLVISLRILFVNLSSVSICRAFVANTNCWRFRNPVPCWELDCDIHDSLCSSQ